MIRQKIDEKELNQKNGDVRRGGQSQGRLSTKLPQPTHEHHCEKISIASLTLRRLFCCRFRVIKIRLKSGIEQLELNREQKKKRDTKYGTKLWERAVGGGLRRRKSEVAWVARRCASKVDLMIDAHGHYKPAGNLHLLCTKTALHSSLFMPHTDRDGGRSDRATGSRALSATRFAS